MKGTVIVPGIGALSPRESAVLKLATDGMTDSSICRSLGIAPGTLGTYWVRIRNKTGLTSRAELAAAHTRHHWERMLVQTVSVVAEQTIPYGEDDGVRVADVFEALPIATLVVRVDGTILAANRAACHLFARRPPSTATVFSYLQPRDVQMFGHLLRAAANGDSELRFRAAVAAYGTIRGCHWLIKRFSKDRTHVLLLVSEPETFGLAITDDNV